VKSIVKVHCNLYLVDKCQIEEIDHNDDNSNYFELLQTSLRLHDVA